MCGSNASPRWRHVGGIGLFRKVARWEVDCGAHFSSYLSDNQFKTHKYIAMFAVDGTIEGRRACVLMIARLKEHGRGF